MTAGEPTGDTIDSPGGPELDPSPDASGYD